MAHGGSGAVHLVLSVQREHNVQGMRQFGMRPVIDVRTGIQHVQKIFRVVQPLVGWRCLPAAGAMVRQRCNCRHLACTVARRGVRPTWGMLPAARVTYR